MFEVVLRLQPVVPFGFTMDRLKPPMKRTPGHASGVQQIANRYAAHLRLVARGAGANIADRIGIVDVGQRSVGSAGHKIPVPFKYATTPLVWPDTRFITPTDDGPKVRSVRVIAQDEILSIVPEAGHRVAVVIAHDQAIRIIDSATSRRRSGGSRVQREQVHQTRVGRLLLGLVVMILIGSRGLRNIEPERIGGARAIGRVQIRVVRSAERPSAR